jgi:hypothetical protein
MDFNPSLNDDKRESDISTPKLATDGKKSDISIPLLSIYNDIFNNIDPLLFISAFILGILIRVTVYDIIDINDFTGIDKGKSNLAKMI